MQIYGKKTISYRALKNQEARLADRFFLKVVSNSSVFVARNETHPIWKSIEG
jgi:hypothetical protein